MSQLTSKTTLSRSPRTIVAIAALMALAACQSTPPRHAQLEEARRAYQDVSNNPEVLRSAQLELEQARKTLYQAETAWKERQDARETDHLAYLATQQSKVALNIGMQHAADNMVTAAGMERQRALSDAKTRDIQAARADVQMARADVQVARAEAEAARQDAQALEQELKELQGKPTPRGMVVVLEDVLFDVGKSELKPGAQSRLEKLAAVLKNHPDRKLMVEGYTDSTGSDAFNQTLSQQRAESVKNALAGMGVASERIEAKGFGETKPVASNDTAAGRQQNRRVEVVFSDTTGAFATP